MFRQKSAGSLFPFFSVRVIDSDRIGVRKIRAERREHLIHSSHAVKQSTLFSFTVQDARDEMLTRSRIGRCKPDEPFEFLQSVGNAE